MPNTVLTIVDDDPGMLALLRDIAEDIGFSVRSYRDGRDFCENFDSSMGIIVLDLMMPGIDGVEVMRFLASKSYRQPLILISGYDVGVLHSAQTLAEEQNLNVVTSLTKPIEVATLQRLLMQLRSQDHEQAKNNAAGDYQLHAAEFEEAIQQNHLLLHYQPQICLHSGTLTGVEALARWQHPEYGLIYPDQFIGLAEDNDLMGELTSWVINQSVMQVKQWRAMGISPRMSINVSAQNINSLELPEQLSKTMEENHLDASSFMFEVTESALMSSLVTSLDILTRLRIKGFELSIDDFGTGYSSLSQLHRIPFTELKIDKSFVMRLDQDKEALAIVETCIMLGQKLKMQVLAEGVENEYVLDKLKQIGCDIAQGYAIAKPMPAESLMDWLDSDKAYLIAN